jgi:NAD(P)-dependent dehydrogenase (short-subunit alcohol dehydrogenase family)
MIEPALHEKIVIVTGGARRVGRALALASARAGADVVIHYCNSVAEAESTRREIEALGRRAWTMRCDFSVPGHAREILAVSGERGHLFGLINSAATFGGATVDDTRISDWDRHFAINLTAPFVLTQAFAETLGANSTGRVINILDWRALRPGSDHFPYSLTKVALAALTRSMALSLAPRIAVNGLALGAILPPEVTPASPEVLSAVPAARWGNLEEVQHAARFLLTGPSYVTGEIIAVDGGRHLH